MKAWQVVQNFGLNNLKQVELPSRSLEKDEVRVKIRACSLNYRDLLVVNGHYNPHQPLPLIPVSDGAGEVLEVGFEVSSLKPGSRVCATFSQNWEYGRVNDEAQNYTLGSPLPGMLADEGIFKERGLLKFPSFLSYVEAATLPCAAVTAFNALTHEAELKPGDSVLLQGTGGVSIFALQFAKALGLVSIATSG
ncbi:MAG TPA: NAD(P)-dependent alcohol dehydrogenase, partial [Myxococcota bacterium]|nr:NAD(P)-dependent alcohol dehydrogenase [Myxococcota bacterium]